MSSTAKYIIHIDFLCNKLRTYLDIPQSLIWDRLEILDCALWDAGLNKPHARMWLSDWYLFNKSRHRKANVLLVNWYFTFRVAPSGTTDKPINIALITILTLRKCKMPYPYRKMTSTEYLHVNLHTGHTSMTTKFKSCNGRQGVRKRIKVSASIHCTLVDEVW